MAGAEGEPRLDLDADVVGADLGAIVRAMDEKPPGADRLETGKRIGDPVALFGEAECRGRAVSSPAAAATSSRKSVLVGLETEIGLDQPSLAAARPRRLGLERGRGGLGRLEALDDEIGDRARARSSVTSASVRGVVGRQTFEHAKFL